MGTDPQICCWLCSRLVIGMSLYTLSAFLYLFSRAYFFLQLGPILTTLTHLSASILVDLELDKPCQNEFNKHPGKQMLPKWSAKFSIPESRTMEHRRLAMAAYSFSARYDLATNYSMMCALTNCWIVAPSSTTKLNPSHGQHIMRRLWKSWTKAERHAPMVSRLRKSSSCIFWAT